MIQLVWNVSRGFSGWPFYVIPKWCVGTAREQPYIEHERTHCHRQKMLTPIWWALWLVSKNFRHHEESLAYKAEIQKIVEMGQEVDCYYYADQMATGYRGAFEFLEASMLINRWMK